MTERTPAGLDADTVRKLLAVLEMLASTESSTMGAFIVGPDASREVLAGVRASQRMIRMVADGTPDGLERIVALVESGEFGD